MAAIINIASGYEVIAGQPADELSNPDDLSFEGDFIAVPFADQLAPPAPTPDAGAFVWQRSIVDSSGNVLTDARVTVRYAETNAVAEIYEDRAATIRKSNPFLVDSEGFARFYALAGLYNITAERAGLERVFENVLLGIRVTDIPDITELVAPIVEDALAVELSDLDTALAALPELVSFKALAAGGGGEVPSGYTHARQGVGFYRLTHNIGHQNYHVKLTVWDPSGDRVYSAMLTDKQNNYFEYRVRSIFDTASNSDADTNIELTI